MSSNALFVRSIITSGQIQQTPFEASLAPMKFIAMDLIGEFHPPSSKGNRYALTVICLHTGFVFCIPLKTKSAEDVV